jgi:ankyrin repeat protein
LREFIGCDALRRVQTLLDEGADPNVVGTGNVTPLIWACANRQAGLQLVLLDKGADVNARDDLGRTALMYAVWAPDAMDLLINAGADVEAVDNNGVSVLAHAVLAGPLESVAFLLRKGAIPDARALVSAASVWPTPDRCQLLIAAGGDVNSADVDGWTPLMAAVQIANARMVEWLISKGADINATNREGQCAFRIAEAADDSGDRDVGRIKRLLKRGSLMG